MAPAPSDRFIIEPDREIDPDRWYEVGREDPAGPWRVFEACSDARQAARLDLAAPRAVAAGYLGTRLGRDILAGEVTRG